jgi:hypothetical protein
VWLATADSRCLAAAHSSLAASRDSATLRLKLEARRKDKDNIAVREQSVWVEQWHRHVLHAKEGQAALIQKEYEVRSLRKKWGRVRTLIDDFLYQIEDRLKSRQQSLTGSTQIQR